jgi:hypothetical protein
VIPDTEIMDKTSSMGLWTHANEFYLASRVLAQPDNSHLMHPSYYLISHSIELALKAFLRGNGLSLDELKNYKKLGHDLQKLLEKAVSLELELYLTLSQKDEFAISTINEYYKNKELEYIVTGKKSYPKIEFLISFNGKLLNGIRQFCFDRMDHHVQKPDNHPLEPIR